MSSVRVCDRCGVRRALCGESRWRYERCTREVGGSFEELHRADVGGSTAEGVSWSVEGDTELGISEQKYNTVNRLRPAHRIRFAHTIEGVESESSLFLKTACRSHSTLHPTVHVSRLAPLGPAVSPAASLDGCTVQLSSVYITQLCWGVVCGCMPPERVASTCTHPISPARCSQRSALSASLGPLAFASLNRRPHFLTVPYLPPLIETAAFSPRSGHCTP